MSITKNANGYIICGICEICGSPFIFGSWGQLKIWLGNDLVYELTETDIWSVVPRYADANRANQLKK
jgi:hypothetical protein